MAKRTYDIDGLSFSTLDEFYDVVSEVLIPGARWGRNLDAFNDILRGGFGTPDSGFRIRWRNSKASRERLGPAVFQQLVDIIGVHCSGGAEQQDGVELVLC